MQAKTWEEMPREDLRLIPFITALGWRLDFHHDDKRHKRDTPEHIPHWPVSFERDGVYLWKAGNLSTLEMYWVSANLVDGHFVGHQKFPELQEAIDHFEKIKVNEISDQKINQQP